MGFTQAKRALLQALKLGTYQHEIREVLSEKNLLAVGDVSVEEVMRILARSTGKDYSASPHHWDRSSTVHLFRPRVDGIRWYVKAYFVEEPEGTAVFISVHH